MEASSEQESNSVKCGKVRVLTLWGTRDDDETRQVWTHEFWNDPDSRASLGRGAMGADEAMRSLFEFCDGNKSTVIVVPPRDDDQTGTTVAMITFGTVGTRVATILQAGMRPPAPCPTPPPLTPVFEELPRQRVSLQLAMDNRPAASGPKGRGRNALTKQERRDQQRQAREMSRRMNKRR